ncbi:MAG: conserved rane protein of unknown function [Hyphomicrobiales bacterium]|nr:conserved rane protein of unknown function [Hyphomicrobiales bacterium]
MLEIIAPAGPDALWTTVMLSVVLGGAAAAATGRAVARTWRPASRLIGYAALLAGALGFLDYALFENPVIPGGRVVDALVRVSTEPVAALGDLGGALAGFGVTFVLMLAIAMAAYRIARGRQIAQQYGFAFVRKGLFSWHERAAD